MPPRLARSSASPTSSRPPHRQKAKSSAASSPSFPTPKSPPRSTPTKSSKWNSSGKTSPANAAPGASLSPSGKTPSPPAPSASGPCPAAPARLALFPPPATPRQPRPHPRFRGRKLPHRPHCQIHRHPHPPPQKQALDRRTSSKRHLATHFSRFYSVIPCPLLFRQFFRFCSVADGIAMPTCRVRPSRVTVPVPDDFHRSEHRHLPELRDHD